MDFLHVPARKSQIPLGRPRSSRSALRPSTRESKCNVRSGSGSVTRIPSSVSKLRRSVSCSDMREAYLTPICRVGSGSLRSPNSVNKYPSNNKEWTTNQLKRLNGFLKDVNPEIQPLKKTFDTRTYVFVMNLLWNQIDPSLAFDEKNKEAIGDYLKMFRFPGTIKPAVLKMPSVPMNYPHIVSIFSWLLDAIEHLSRASASSNLNCDDPSFGQLFDRTCEYFTVLFKGCDSKDDILSDLLKIYANYLFRNIKNSTEIEKEEKSLNTEVTKEKAELDEKKIEIDTKRNFASQHQTKISKQKQLLAERRNATLNTIEQCLANQKHLSEQFQEKQAKNQKLREGKEVQPCSKADYDRLIEEKHTLTFNNQLKRERLNELDQKGNELNIEMFDLKQRQQRRIEKLNNCVMEVALQMPDLEMPSIRDSHLLRKDMIDEVKNFVQMKKQIDELFYEEEIKTSGELEKVGNLMQEYTKKEKKLLTKQEEVQQLSKQQELKCFAEAKCVEEKEEELRKIKQQLNDLVQNVINLDLLEQQERENAKQCQLLTEEMLNEMKRTRESVIKTWKEIIKHNTTLQQSLLRTLRSIMGEESPMWTNLLAGLNKLDAKP